MYGRDDGFKVKGKRSRVSDVQVDNLRVFGGYNENKQNTKCNYLRELCGVKNVKGDGMK